MSRSWVIGILVVMLMSGALQSCGGTPRPEVQLQAVPPDDVISRARESMRRETSFRFELRDKGGGTPVLPGQSLQVVKGFVGPDVGLQATLELTGETNSVFVEMEVRTIGGTAYFTDPINGRWDSGPLSILPVNFTEMGRSIAQIIRSMTELRHLGHGSLDGTNVYVVGGVVPSEVFGVLVYDIAKGQKVDITIWVDPVEWVVRRAVLRGPIVSGGTESSTKTLNMSEFGKIRQIDRPR